MHITYQPRGKGWWVLSGENKQGQVLYLKTLEKDGVLYGVTEAGTPVARWLSMASAATESMKALPDLGRVTVDVAAPLMGPPR